jgi:hypothetical protein
MTVTFQSAASDGTFGDVDLDGLFFEGQLPKDIKSVVGFTKAIGGNPVIQKERDGSVVGKVRGKLGRVEVRFSFRGLAVLRPKSIILSGSVPWEMMYRVLVRLVPRVKGIHFKVNNTAVRFYLKKHVKMRHVYDEYRARRGLPYKMYFEPEIFSRLTIVFNSGITVHVFFNGTVTAQGRDLTGIESAVKSVLDSYTSPYGPALQKNPTPIRKNLKAKREHMAATRYNAAQSWNSVRPGHYVRPGPNKVPRFYEVPKNPRFVIQKVLRAYHNVGVAVPKNVKVKLGIANENQLKEKATKKKTVTEAPEGMYLRPGPGGLLKAYKIPKNLEKGKKTVIEAYTKAGINIPSNVKNLFRIEKVASPTRTVTGTVNNTGVFRIGTLECSRYTIEDLQKIAKDLNIAHHGITSKKILCKLIQREIAPGKKKSEENENFELGSVPHIILAHERKIQRKGRSRLLDSFKISELKNFVTAYDNSLNTSGTKKQLIDLLIDTKRKLDAFEQELINVAKRSPSPSPSPVHLGPGFTQEEIAYYKYKVKEGKVSQAKLIDMMKNKFRKILGENVPKKELENFQVMYAQGKTVRNFLNSQILRLGFNKKHLEDLRINFARLRRTTKGEYYKAEIKKLKDKYNKLNAIRKNLETRYTSPKGPLIRVPVETL